MKQFWPEIDTYVRLNPNMRLFFVASETREERVGTNTELGANLDFYLKPLLKLKRITVFQLDESKSRPLMIRVGYRYLPSTNGPTEHRPILEATGRFPLLNGILLSDRNRADFRFISGQFSWRYRNRITIERTFGIRSFEFTPYARAEAYWDSNAMKWSRTALSAGVVVPITKRVELETYYEHQNDTSNPPNRQVSALGVALNLHFRREQ